MQRLEAHLGFTLFERTGRSAHLNRRGAELLAQTQALLQQFARLGAPAQDDGRAVRLCIGAIASVQRAGLPAVLAGFHRAWPAATAAWCRACPWTTRPMPASWTWPS
jgi:DNA-binding transcriptional LysR family regulator